VAAANDAFGSGPLQFVYLQKKKETQTGLFSRCLKNV
jgi:hypothetical protein